MDKEKKLRLIIKKTGGLVIAFSGGVDSTFLSKVAFDELGGRAVAVTATSPTYPMRELREAEQLAKLIGIRHIVVDSNELKIPGFSANPANRCYFCKKELFQKIKKIAKKLGIKYVADGSNVDDDADYRPGRKAVKELGVLSPIKQAGLGKAEIRVISKKLGLPTADKQSYACLASRFPYGTTITAGNLNKIDQLEELLMRHGLSQLRVRYHDNLVRLEVMPKDLKKLAGTALADKVVHAAKKLGFKYVALDMQGYRTGSMNEVLRK